MSSARTKAALAAARRRGVRLGGWRGGKPITRKAQGQGRATRTRRAIERATDLVPILNELKANGILTHSALARALSERGIPTALGRRCWTAVGVARVMARVD